MGGTSSKIVLQTLPFLVYEHLLRKYAVQKAPITLNRSTLTTWATKPLPLSFDLYRNLHALNLRLTMTLTPEAIIGIGGLLIVIPPSIAVVWWWHIRVNSASTQTIIRARNTLIKCIVSTKIWLLQRASYDSNTPGTTSSPIAAFWLYMWARSRDVMDVL